MRRKAVYVHGDHETYRLSYQLIHHTDPEDGRRAGYYGIVVEQYTMDDPGHAGTFFDRCEIRGVTEDVREAEEFFEMTAEGKVTPAVLCEIYDDWMSAFHPRWIRGGRQPGLHLPAGV